MVQIYRSFSGLMPFVTPLALLGLLAAALLYRTRLHRWGDRRSAALYTGMDLIILGNLTVLAALTLTRGYGQPRSLNLIPFYEVYEAVHATSGATAPMVEVVGNASLLVPLAAVIGVRLTWSKPILSTTGLVLMVTSLIEGLQFALGLGRVASITDVLLPTLGAAVAALLVAVVMAGGRGIRGERRSDAPSATIPQGAAAEATGSILDGP